MTKILGLDLGTNSIGWALIENEKILGMGSRIFPEGVVNLGEGEGRETSKNASRTDARGTRRQFFRRRLRKRYLLRKLAENNLCPINYTLVKEWNGKEIFKNQQLQNWFQLNPYELRAKAVKEKISLEELGRIFYHMIQRRGFQSNSRSAGADNNEKSVIFKGDSKIGKIGISETLESIQKAKTLGSYLHTVYPKHNKPYSGEQERIRNRYTTRQMYIDEFETIWEYQKEYHSELTEKLKTIFGGRKKDGYTKDGVLFHQRPLRSQKHLVGYCTFEPKKTKCPISAIPNELRRVYEWVNNLKCDVAGEPIKFTAEEIKKIIAVLLSKEKPRFKEIRKAINKLESYYQFNYKNDDAIVGTHTISNLSNKNFFGEKWFYFTEKEQEDIWHILSFFDDREKLKQYAIEKWGFNEERAIKISKFNLKEGYANLSRKAINNILPFLKLGFQYDVAVGLGGVKNTLGSKWKVSKQFVLDNVPEIVRSNLKGGYIEPLKNMLKNEYRLSDKQLNKLYHHSSAIEALKLLDKLPVNLKADREIQSIKNPIVITALFEIRKLVNELIDTYGKPDVIKVELARELKASKKNRYETRRKQQELEKQNDRVKDELEKLGQRINHTAILKYKLWEECDKRCPFTGKNIEVNELFSGEIQIEHIFPWSRSLNDSFMNKTLCFSDENRAKGNNTPYEFYSKQGEDKWEEIKLQALSCFKTKPNYPNAYHKFKQFVKKKHDADFISRQLNDTRYISKEAKNYLSKICNDVQVAPGQMTATSRHHWGLNTILNKDGDTKSRDDHRHHAVDALVMACTTGNHLQKLTKRNRYRKNHELKDFEMPWQYYRQDAETWVEKILVSHKKSNNVLTIRTHKTKKNGKIYTNKGIAARGQLHKEFVFGKRTAPDDIKAFHIRKPIESLTTKKHIDKVVDETIRLLILKQVQKLGDFVKGKIPEGTFYKTDGKGIKLPQLFLPNKNGKPIPIKKVRMREPMNKAIQLKSNINQYVNPRNNHHVLIYNKLNSESLDKKVVSQWEVVERKKQKIPTVMLPISGEKIIQTFSEDDMFILFKHEDEINWDDTNYTDIKNNLYKVQKIAGADYFMEICFRKHTDSREDKTAKRDYVYIKGFGNGKTGWFTFKPIKVKVSSTGRIEKI